MEEINMINVLESRKIVELKNKKHKPLRKYQQNKQTFINKPLQNLRKRRRKYKYTE